MTPSHSTGLAVRLSFARGVAVSVLCAALVACGGGGNGGTRPATSAATGSTLAAVGARPGVTPFISFVRLSGNDVAALAAVRYTIAAKPGTASSPVDVTYAMAALARRGYVAQATGLIDLPVFGLYANHVNRLTIELQFIDGSSKSLPVDVATTAFADPHGVYASPTIVKKRVPGSTLGVNFFAMKSVLGTPVVVDSDGETRWSGASAAISNADSSSSAFHDNAFIVGDRSAPRLTRLELDGTYSTSSLVPASPYLNFHHNIDPGKIGLLAEMDVADGASTNLESVAVEISSSGVVLNEWNFATLLSDYMRSHGDDPTAIVSPGIDWFHMNSVTYDPRDDTLVVSSREHFVVKVDYRSGNIVWIFGDPTKYWYTFASLRAKALTVADGGLYPVGQHSLSITSDGLLMLFNNGRRSFNQPAGAPTGIDRTHSAVSAYAIDPVSRTAREAWRFDYGESIYSDICSSAYEGKNGSILVSYAAAEDRTSARLVGLDSNHAVAFDFRYPSPAPCATSWNAIPIAFEKLHFE